METADVWAVGFVVGFVLLPIGGSLVVLVFYFQRRNRRGGQPYAVPDR